VRACVRARLRVRIPIYCYYANWCYLQLCRSA